MDTPTHVSNVLPKNALKTRSHFFNRNGLTSLLTSDISADLIWFDAWDFCKIRRICYNGTLIYNRKQVRGLSANAYVKGIKRNKSINFSALTNVPLLCNAIKRYFVVFKFSAKNLQRRAAEISAKDGNKDRNKDGNKDRISLASWSKKTKAPSDFLVGHMREEKSASNS